MKNTFDLNAKLEGITVAHTFDVSFNADAKAEDRAYPVEVVLDFSGMTLGDVLNEAVRNRTVRLQGAIRKAETEEKMVEWINANKGVTIAAEDAGKSPYGPKTKQVVKVAMTMEEMKAYINGLSPEEKAAYLESLMNA